MEQTAPFALTKLKAVQRHLQFAIQQFFAGGDIVSIHTLAHATFQVTNDLLEVESQPTIISEIKSQIKDSARKSVVDAMNSPANFLKHADRDPESKLDFNPLLTHSLLFFAVDQFRALHSPKIAILECYRIWFLWSNPTWLKNPDEERDLDLICKPFVGKWATYLDTVAHELQSKYLLTSASTDKPDVGPNDSIVPL